MLCILLSAFPACYVMYRLLHFEFRVANTAIYRHKTLEIPFNATPLVHFFYLFIYYYIFILILLLLFMVLFYYLTLFVIILVSMHLIVM